MYGLPDYLKSGLKIIFVGYNPGEKSAILQHHYAGRSNQFWKLLFDSGLTERLYTPEEDSLLLMEGYGLTNLVSRPSKSSSDLSPEEMLEGAEELKEKLSKYQPEIVCFLGKEVYRKFAGVKSSVAVEFGAVEGDTVFHGIMEFVAPNPSGRSTVPYREKLLSFIRLKELTGKGQ